MNESKSKFNLWLSEHPESFHPVSGSWCELSCDDGGCLEAEGNQLYPC